MNFIKVLETLSDKELLTAKGSRRDSFDKLKNIGKNVALASIPFGLAATSTKTAAATSAMTGMGPQADPIAVLNYALTLEYLERDFYQMGVSTNGLIPQADLDIFGLIADHEQAHVDFLIAGITAAGGTPVAQPTFDFTGAPGGLNLDTFSNYQTFMLLAQGFEDTGVRAYKGQAGALANSNELLTYALQIHSVEARHASQVRRMRSQKGWIVGNQSPAAPLDPVYAGEQNTVQGGVDLAPLFPDFGTDAVTAAFDEPLTMDEVIAIASAFIVS